MYPSIIIGLGISKETTISDVISVEGLRYSEMTEMFANINSKYENCVWICSKYLGLSDFDEILEKI